MRTLKFIVEGQTIRQDPNCSFDGLVPGTEGFLYADFSFSPEWNGYVKVAAFYSRLGKEYPPQTLKNGKKCLIPAEALEKRIFKIRIIGKNAEGATMLTDKITIDQDGGKK